MIRFGEESNAVSSSPLPHHTANSERGENYRESYIAVRSDLRLRGRRKLALAKSEKTALRMYEMAQSSSVMLSSSLFRMMHHNEIWQTCRGG